MKYTCSDCPRKCGAERSPEKLGGFCLCPSLPFVTRAAPHFGEETCISGQNGSGAVFFSGCNLKCVFCQNMEISRKRTGKQVSACKLAEIMLELERKGVHNINLVTGTPYIRAISSSLKIARDKGLSVPVVWNSSGYENAETIREFLDGLVDIYLPDFKYYDKALAAKLSNASDYPETALSAISEMFRQTGPYVIDESGILRKGVVIRHLILPGQSENSMDVIDLVADTFGDSVLFSLMSQYTPMGDVPAELARTVSEEENSLLIHYMKQRKLVGYCQDTLSAGDEMIPDFDLTGVIN